jgi:PleD family two-component response regulator
VTAFLSANQTAPGVACELFFLDADEALYRAKAAGQARVLGATESLHA